MTKQLLLSSSVTLCSFLLQCLLLPSRTSLAWVALSSSSSSLLSLSLTSWHQEQRTNVLTGRRCHRRHRQSTLPPLQGRVMDTGSEFFRERRGEFKRLEGVVVEEEFGPGPALIFYNVPQGIQDEELVDMLRDGSPKAIKKGVSLLRMDTSTTDDWMDLSLEAALKKVVLHSKDPSFLNEPDPLTTDAGLLATTPVLFFSGFTNREMMSTFQIISHEVHKETQGRLSVACAMANPETMSQKLRQVLMEVSGDHVEVIKPRFKKV